VDFLKFFSPVFFKKY